MNLVCTLLIVPLCVTFPCQNLRWYPLIYPISFDLKVKSGFQVKEPYPNTHILLMCVFITLSMKLFSMFVLYVLWIRTAFSNVYNMYNNIVDIHINVYICVETSTNQINVKRIIDISLVCNIQSCIIRLALTYV